MSWAKPTDVLVVQHLPHEGSYAIGTVLEAAGLPVRSCRTWAGGPVPESPDGLAALVVMGGPMAAYDDSPAFTTRTAELTLLRAALEAEVPVLGVCLGAQLLAVAAGGVARPGGGQQIGWGAVRTTPAASADPMFVAAPEHLRVLHWHGDTMDLPADATLLASCDRYPVQAFRTEPPRLLHIAGGDLGGALRRRRFPVRGRRLPHDAVAGRHLQRGPGRPRSRPCRRPA
ncbi:type 1 glutamine amidotransferase [Streptomyces sp. NPDC007983]|uniref:type 1 glutamine amidotransferase n=1 Tax=Streptomyces sp. NPDC007983 TaxID=3364800 RepID=UPI0036EFE094